MSVTYPAIIKKEQQGYSLAFPDIPGCSVTGFNKEDVVASGKRAMESRLLELKQASLNFPEASVLDEECLSLEETCISIESEAV